MMAASYYIEVLSNLGQVDLYIKLDNHVSPSDIRLVDSKTLQLSKTATLTLPVSVNDARATTSILPSKSSKWMRIRVPISISTNRLQHLQSTVPLSQISGPICADSVRGFASICCRNCQAQLTEGSMGGVVVRDLPSTFWSELVECWVCHPEEDKLRINPDLLHLFEPDTGKIQNKETEEVVRDVWVGNTHLLAPGSLFRELPMRNVELDKKTRFHNSYMELLCDSCNYVIGEVGYMGPKRLFKLFVHRSDVCFTESPKLSIGLSQTVTKEFIDHAAAHALYHFIIEERKSCEPVALVSMTAWNTDIMAEHENGTASGRVIKVTYVDRKGDGFAKKIKDTEANGSAEHIIMLNDDCDELLKTLEANSLYYPPPFHMMPGGTCSFLHM